MWKGERERNLAQRMRALNIPIDLAEFEELLTIRQDGGPLQNSMASHYLSRDSIGLTVEIYIKIILNSKSPITICGFQVCLPWTDTPLQLLPAPVDPSVPTYKFPGPTSKEFEKSQVIFESCVTLKHGQCIEGFVLGFHTDPIPPSFCHGTEVPIVLTVEDQFGEIYSRELFVKVDRAVESRTKPKDSAAENVLAGKTLHPQN